MTRRNLENIRRRFQEETGVALRPGRQPLGRRAVLVAVAALALMLAAFGHPIFSPLNGDALALTGTYLGAGLVEIEVENRSDRDLRFQEQLKLINWFTSREVALTAAPEFENVSFPAGSRGTMKIDLSGACDVAALEESANPQYYLLLTNQDFLFGQDWMCSITFSETVPQVPELAMPEGAAPNLEQIEEELRDYFSRTYRETPAFNQENFRYQQQVSELLARQEGIVPAVSPQIPVTGPYVPLDPALGLQDLPEEYHWTWTYTDVYGRMVAGMEEKALEISLLTPKGQSLPLAYCLVYPQGELREGSAFQYGRIRPFSQLEAVYEDGDYAVYDITDLIYGEGDDWTGDLLAIFPEAGVTSEALCQAREFLRDNLRECFGYPE